MNLYECDRCCRQSKEYKYIRRWIINRYDDNEKHIDLCFECADEVYEFLKNWPKKKIK